VTFDRLYRRDSSVLGTNIDAGQSNDANRELNLILWRIEGSFWLIGALGNEVHGGMFNVVLPAIDFNSTGATSASFPTLYGDGVFQSRPDGFYELANESEADRQAMGGAVSAPEGWGWPSSAEVPAWLTDITSESAHYKFILRSNEPFAPLAAPDDLAQQLGDAIAGFDGMKCNEQAVVRFTGEPSFAKNRTRLDGARRLVANLKVPPQWGEISYPPFSTGEVLAAMKVDDQGHITNQLMNGWRGADFLSGLSASMEIPFWGSANLDTVSANVFSGHLFSFFPTDQCELDRLGLRYLFRSCAKDDLVFQDPFGKAVEIRYTRRFLLPRQSTPGRRAHLFVNSYPPPGSCGAAAQLGQAFALACLAQSGGAFPLQLTPPTISKPEDLGGFERWLGTLGALSARQLSRVYFRNLPDRVVKDLRGGRVGSGNLDGDHGNIILQLETGLNNVVNTWIRVTGDLAEVATAVKTARLDIQAADEQERKDQADLIIRQAGVIAEIAKAAASFFSLDKFPFAGAAAAEVAIGAGIIQLQQVETLKDIAGQQNETQVARALNHLRASSLPLFVDFQRGLGDLRSSVAQIDQLTNQLAQTENRANYEAAKGAGQDFFKDSDGKAVPIPVNTALRRQYDITQLRYKRALEDAKRLAYIARLAIEQRIGTRLSTISKRIGALDPPAQWADDVCSVTGVDYNKLRTPGDGGAGGFFSSPTPAEKEIISNLADQFVGDYVTKLENFVEYYNIEYPSHDGDDTAVISLRDDLLGADQACLKTSPNLLLYSDQLQLSDRVTEDGTVVQRGWALLPCIGGDTKCLSVSAQDTLTAPKGPPSSGGAVSWLHDQMAATSLTSQASTALRGTIPQTVMQRVHLAVGNYLLSWWDQARTQSGALLSTSGTPVPYRAGVYTVDGAQVAGGAYTPPIAVITSMFVDGGSADGGSSSLTADELWPVRRSILVSIRVEGDYFVGFGGSLSDSSLGSVAIADVQLESTSKPEAGPGDYIRTRTSRDYIATGCTSKTPQDLQAAFERHCDVNGNCFYELATPILIDTSKLGTRRSRLNGRLSAGNYNFRHIDVALNLVGTGLRNCEADPTQGCFGSGYLEYSLFHDAFQSGVLGRNGAVQCFNFGSASINHGKGLAAERFITVPIGSSDNTLLTQAGILKPEFRGRTLDGSYRLRIWDTPSLAWNRLEDVQIVLKYRYWSPIATRPPTN